MRNYKNINYTIEEIRKMCVAVFDSLEGLKEML